MTYTVDAIYENGVLRPLRALPLKEQEKVQVTIQSPRSWVDETYGLLHWKGSGEDAERFATDPEMDYPPSSEQP